jgi:hypothetical protein
VPDDLIYVNGVSGITGEYLISPMQAASVAQFARSEARDEHRTGWLKQVAAKLNAPTFGLPFNVHPDVVAEAGWGVVFASDEAPEVQRALQPLIEHRSNQVPAEKVKILDHQPGEAWLDWLARHEVGPGDVDPKKVPYYLLLVGSPERIPFELQYLLDVEYAVGRLHFDDADAYGRYAQAVVDYETSAGTPRDRAAAFFGTRHQFDRATQLSADSLVGPLSAAFSPGGEFANDVTGYEVRTAVGPAATKSAFGDVLSGTGPMGRPSLLFSATHGMGGWPPGHPDQTAKQGALLCQDWPGIGQIGASQYFAASDLPADAQVHGLIAFFFACYGAGTPAFDPYVHQEGAPPPQIAPQPFLAALPSSLLSHPEGAALAVVGHIERAWGCSFLSAANQQLLIPFKNVVGRILLGQPIGFALKDFNEKFAVLAAELSRLVERIGHGLQVPDDALASAWLQRNDAQNYVLLGDPAVAVKAQ